MKKIARIAVEWNEAGIKKLANFKEHPITREDLMKEWVEFLMMDSGSRVDHLTTNTFLGWEEAV